MKTNQRKVLVIDNNGPGARSADVVVFPISYFRKNDYWNAYTGRLITGPEYVILGSGFWNDPLENGFPGKKVLVTCGGSDPHGLTLRLLGSLKDLDPGLDLLSVVLGPNYTDVEGTEEILGEFPYPTVILKGTTDLAPVMAETSVAVATFGITLYELARMGVPVLFFYPPDEAENALLLKEQGMGIPLGPIGSFEPGPIRETLQNLLEDRAQWSAIRDSGRRLVDGRGAHRVAETILSLVVG
ncbi:hypothetical protein ACFLT7_01490 [candidate division KSB1 bacterium]